MKTARARTLRQPALPAQLRHCHSATKAFYGPLTLTQRSSRPASEIARREGTMLTVSYLEFVGLESNSHGRAEPAVMLHHRLLGPSKSP